MKSFSSPRYTAALPAMIMTFITIVILASQAQAQLQVRLSANKKSYLINQSIKVNVEITNNSGRDMTLRSSTTPWLSFHVTNSGRSMPKAVNVDYKPIVIPMGKTVHRSVDLSTSYALGNYGNYTVEAAVNMPGPTGNAISSNRATFNVAGGKTKWSQRVGIPKVPGEVREYKIISFSGNNALELFVETSSVNRNHHISTIALGKVVGLRGAVGVLDMSNNMHILYQIQPAFYVHACISPYGKDLFARYIKPLPGSRGQPHLAKLPNGSITVNGGAIHDPKAAAVKRKKIHNASDRPPGVFQ